MNVFVQYMYTTRKGKWKKKKEKGISEKLWKRIQATTSV